MKVVFDSSRLVDFAIGLVNSVFKITEEMHVIIILLIKPFFGGLVEWLLGKYMLAIRGSCKTNFLYILLYRGV